MAILRRSPLTTGGRELPVPSKLLPSGDRPQGGARCHKTALSRLRKSPFSLSSCYELASLCLTLSRCAHTTMRSVLSLSMLIVGVMVMVMVVQKVEAQIPLDIIKLLAGLPDCTITCLSTAVTSAGCVVGNQTCTCNADNKVVIQASARPCLLAACDAPDILSMSPFPFFSTLSRQ